MAQSLQIEERNLQREAWADLEAQRKRIVGEWAETKAYIAKQEAALAARTAELTQREKALTGAKARLEADTKGLRQEVAGLEARAAHARSIVEELEQKRDELRAEILATVAKPEPEPPANVYRVPLDRAADRDLTHWAEELDAQDCRQTEEKSSLAKLKTALDRESIALADEKKVLAEQFALLGAARAEWQESEGRTVAEMEDLARALRQRENDLSLREERIAKAETRRKADDGEMEHLRVRLEAWQAKLLAASRLWHAERECRENALEVRSKAVALREAVLNAALERWESVPESEHDQLRAELILKLQSPEHAEAAIAPMSELAALRDEFARTARLLNDSGGAPDDLLPLADEEVTEEPGPELVLLPFSFNRAA